MAITLAEINRVTLRQVFLPWFRDLSRDLGCALQADWNPSDAELARLAEAVSQALRAEGEDA